ncbi:MAG: hypothetical protein AABX39_00385, partial [Nanoarchaeota archaeon]
PHCILSYDDEQTLGLARNMVQNILLMDLSAGALIQKTGKEIPSIVLECGTNQTKEADNLAFESLQKFFIKTNTKEGTITNLPSKLLSECFNIKIKKESSITWSDKKDETKEITLRKDIEQLNLMEIQPTDFLGWTNNLDHLILKNKNGTIAPKKLFELEEGKITLRDKAILNLLSTSEFIIKESGFYLFKKITTI